MKVDLKRIEQQNYYQILEVSPSATAKEIQKIDSKSARWIASDALRELTSRAVQRKFQR